MKKLVFLLLWVLLAPTWAQDKPSVNVPTPEGWREDLMKLPPDFAPEMSWTGWEIAEFAPGMFKAQEPDFFSYVFVIEIEEPIADWDEQLLLYFKGLSKAVMKDPELDTSGFKVSLSGEPEARYGTVTWIEPFATKKPQKLYLECRKISDGLWFGCVSPKAWGWPIWTEMRQIRIDFEEDYARAEKSL